VGTYRCERCGRAKPRRDGWCDACAAVYAPAGQQRGIEHAVVGSSVGGITVAVTLTMIGLPPLAIAVATLVGCFGGFTVARTRYQRRLAAADRRALPAATARALPGGHDRD
jgi:Flp pilus assembly protein TadB